MKLQQHILNQQFHQVGSTRVSPELLLLRSAPWTTRIETTFASGSGPECGSCLRASIRSWGNTEPIFPNLTGSICWNIYNLRLWPLDCHGCLASHLRIDTTISARAISMEHYAATERQKRMPFWTATVTLQNTKWTFSSDRAVLSFTRSNVT